MDNPEYEKMPKSLKSLGLSEKEVSEINKLTWCVTEKVHGANFSFIYEGNKLSYAKRKQYLKWTDDFFGFQQVVNELETKVIRIFELLSQNVAADKWIIYGELFGGKYPHPDVTKDSNVQAIQTGVYYTPNITFCAFDIAWEIDGEKEYLDYEKAVNYFERSGLFYAKPLFKGKLKDALEFNTRINSKIPESLNHPLLDNNLIEGIVLKPWIHNDLLAFERPVIKIKNPEFDEEKKFHEAEKWSYIPDISSNNEELNFIIEEIALLINHNRMESVISKTGAIDPFNDLRMKEIGDEFYRDVLADFDEHSDQMLNELSDDQKSWVNGRIRAQVDIFINSFEG